MGLWLGVFLVDDLLAHVLGQDLVQHVVHRQGQPWGGVILVFVLYPVLFQLFNLKYFFVLLG